MVRKAFCRQRLGVNIAVGIFDRDGNPEKVKVGETVINLGKQTEVWLPENRAQGCSTIGKFTLGSKAGGKRLTRRLVTNQGEPDFLKRETHESGMLVATSQCPLGHILTYYDGTQLQYTHLRASMLGYAHINLITILKRFKPEEVLREATDSLYIQKSALHKLEGVEAYVPVKSDRPVRGAVARRARRAKCCTCPTIESSIIPGRSTPNRPSRCPINRAAIR